MRRSHGEKGILVEKTFPIDQLPSQSVGRIRGKHAALAGFFPSRGFPEDAAVVIKPPAALGTPDDGRHPENIGGGRPLRFITDLPALGMMEPEIRAVDGFKGGAVREKPTPYGGAPCSRRISDSFLLIR